MLQLSHKKLDIYKQSMSLVKNIYQLTKNFPDDEKFGLTSQLRRAAISVVSNISEGSSRFSKIEKKRFYEISRSSLFEVDTQLEIALLLEYINDYEIKPTEENVSRFFQMLSKMISNFKLQE